MSRFLAIGSVKRVSKSLHKNWSSTSQDGREYGMLIKDGQHSPLYRFYQQCTHSARGYNSFTAYSIKNGLSGNFPKKYPANSANNTIAHNAQRAWKSFFQRSLSKGWTSLPISKSAQAVSLALTRSYVIVPGIFAIVCGRNIALARAPSDMDFIHPKNTFYMHAQDGHAIFTQLVLSIFECVVLLLRAIYLTILFTPCIALAPFADTFGPHFRKMWLEVVHQTLERAGPAFIKWGQWAATRPDLFPSDLCTELSKLHTKAPEHSFAYSKKVIEKAFGRKISEIFDDFEETPVASGSIAQVHRATLKYQYHGREIKPIDVAVKVRHPGVGESIKRDFEIINLVAKTSKFMPALKWLRLDESVQQFAVFMLSQVDLAREASHLSRFIYNFRRWKDVSFPKPVYPLVHPAVLVETFEQGECVSHYVDDLEGNERLKSALAHIGTNALLKMLLVDNFMHADMHPGNILVRVHQSKSSRRRISKIKPHVIFLDVGMTAELSKNDRGNLIEFFKAVATRDGRTAAECTLKLSKKQDCPDPDAFIKEVKESFDFWGTPEGDLVHPADCMHHLLEQVRRHQVNIDGNVCAVMVTTLVLEGWQRKLDPDYDIMHTLRTLLLKADWAKSLAYTIEGIMAP
ncbi:uncharacterized aarF domain-containing protein kinase 2-like [Ipomoea triloba]|uniref:uncharacterized aarF domain-containing protein kinase 2-like n=1 Tax=Ipomoea triloba TaxID=35885 RepID=UPI00125E60BD|nr:uncharacterized aarF domain-containing protein kinase 2-like [Ipomoea triloba]